jgi:hypothetical protein
MPRIEGWSLVSKSLGLDDAPELIATKVHGYVYGHEDFVNGEMITTSRIAKVVDNGVITKSGTHYVLGEVSKAYEEKYPNARERLLNGSQRVY